MRQIKCFAIILALGAMLGVGATAFASQPLTLTSPDGNLAISFELKANPQPYLSGERAVRFWVIRLWGWISRAPDPWIRILKSSAPTGNRRNPRGKTPWGQNAMCLTITTSLPFRCASVMHPGAVWM